MKTGKMPAAIMPQVVILGQNLAATIINKWYADKVNVRYLNCMNKANFSVSQILQYFPLRPVWRQNISITPAW